MELVRYSSGSPSEGIRPCMVGKFGSIEVEECVE